MHRVPVTPLSTQLPTKGLGKAVHNGPSVWASAPCGRPRTNSWLLASAWPRAGHCNQLGSEASFKDPCLSVASSLCLNKFEGSVWHGRLILTLPVAPAFHVGAGSCPGCFTPIQPPACGVENSRRYPKTTLGPGKKLLAPCFRLAQLAPATPAI